MNVKPCGTNAAYHRHLHDKEVPCRACCRAHVAEQKAMSNATHHAAQRLRDTHPDEFRRYYLDALGYTPTIGRPAAWKTTP